MKFFSYFLIFLEILLYVASYKIVSPPVRHFKNEAKNTGTDEQIADHMGKPRLH
jgi:hypothetical protein